MLHSRWKEWMAAGSINTGNNLLKSKKWTRHPVSRHPVENNSRATFQTKFGRHSWNHELKTLSWKLESPAFLESEFPCLVPHTHDGKDEWKPPDPWTKELTSRSHDPTSTWHSWCVPAEHWSAGQSRKDSNLWTCQRWSGCQTIFRQIPCHWESVHIQSLPNVASVQGWLPKVPRKVGCQSHQLDDHELVPPTYGAWSRQSWHQLLLPPKSGRTGCPQQNLHSTKP